MNSAILRARASVPSAAAGVTFQDVSAFCEARGGYAFPPTLQGRTTGDLPFYKVSDMNLQGNEVDLSNANHWISDDDVVYLRARPFPAGTVVFPKIGAAIATNKKRLLTRPALIDNNVMGVTPDPTICLPEFLLYWFLSFDLTSIAAVGPLPSITATAVRALTVPLPPLDEQRRTARILSSIEIASEARFRVATALDEVFRAALTSLLARHGWEQAALGDLFMIQLGKMLSPKAKVGHRPRPYLRNQDVQWGRINTTDLPWMDFDEREERKFALQPGDLLVCEGGEIGRAAIWEGRLSGCSYQKALMRLRPIGERMLPSFLLYHLMYAFREAALYGDIGSRSTIAHLPAVKLAALPVPVPPLVEQERIVRILSAIAARARIERDSRSIARGVFWVALASLFGEVR